MFSSLKSWINVPYEYRPFIKRSGDGTKLYGDPVISKCYPVGDVKLVTNAAGAEVVSATQLYVDGSENLKITDLVVFGNSEMPIQRISSFYRDGHADIKVVYL